MIIQKNYDLTKLNTFGIKASAKFFSEITKIDEIHTLFNSNEFKTNKRLFLGGGSNVLFTDDYEGIVVLNSIKGIEILEEDNDYVWVKAMTGESWHDLVLYTIQRNLWGIENLAYIPGSVGGAPMQNIGAYGRELKDTLTSLEAFDVITGEKKVFENIECKFGYRDSVFKNELKDKYFIFSIILKLSKLPQKNVEYKILNDFLQSKNIKVHSPKDIADAVTEIRKSKLPDPKVIGNAGSFFKNVFVSSDQKNELFKLYPELPFFEEDAKVKIPAGWLIEKCGWKGKRVGAVGVHDKQALVLVNYGGGTGQDIKNLSEAIIHDVEKQFGIKLSPEVNMI